MTMGLTPDGLYGLTQHALGNVARRWEETRESILGYAQTMDSIVDDGTDGYVQAAIELRGPA